MPLRARVSERTFYPSMMDMIREAGGSPVQEVSYNSEPDIKFDFANREWLLSVKIGSDTKTLLDAWIQFTRHQKESQIPRGFVVFLPDSVREVQPSQDALRIALETQECTVLIDAETIMEERRDLTFAGLVNMLAPLCRRLESKEKAYLPLPRVVELLRRQVQDLMNEIQLTDDLLLRIVTDEKLFGGLGHLKPADKHKAAQFLAAFILMSQILFLRILTQGLHRAFRTPGDPISRASLRTAFEKVLRVDYGPVYEVEVLSSVPENFVIDTYDLIWGLEPERAQHELPGRIFHELMPADIRKMLAAFYTRPLAADLLARLSIGKWDDTVFDPACGSGTILVSAYRRKLQLFRETGIAGDPHATFCESQIYGADIMPFSVHLTAANLASLNVAQSIGGTQIIYSDSLKLKPNEPYPSGLTQTQLFLRPETAWRTDGKEYLVTINDVDVVLMNPPFTKVERGIADFVYMDRFKVTVGGAVGLWGHFVPLAETLLRPGGVLGVVIPINVMRGTESARVRRILFEHWTPLFIVKATRNYGFSEWAEYRDVLLVARSAPPPADHHVKVCLVKRDLNDLDAASVEHIATSLQNSDDLRSDLCDVESFSLRDMNARSTNMMWFCGAASMDDRRTLATFSEAVAPSLHKLPQASFSEGFRPVPSGVSQFLFLTRAEPPERADEAFLSFQTSDERATPLRCRSHLGVYYDVERKALTPTLRTYVGLNKMDVTDSLDYVAHQPYLQLERVIPACGFQCRNRFDWHQYWAQVAEDLESVQTQVVVVHRINPFSPNTHLVAFYSDRVLSPSNQLNVINEEDPQKAKALCVILNSCMFLSQFFLLKEESTGRNVNVRFYDLYEMFLSPAQDRVPALAAVFEKFRRTPFPALCRQFDVDFDQRYDEYWSAGPSKLKQSRIFGPLSAHVTPSKERLAFDKAICKALKARVTDEGLMDLYGAIVREMMIIRHLRSD